MQLVRWILAGLLGVTLYGVVGTTAGYAWYLRSDAYRNSCAAYLSESLALPSEIGSVVPRSRRSREFRDVRVWLPTRRGQALQCDEALVIYTPTPDDPDAYEIRLHGGAGEISNRTWLREDYRFVLESGLRPGFDPNGPRRVDFSSMDVVLQRDDFRLALGDASGFVRFEKDGQVGQATVLCRSFNGQAAPARVELHADFSPQTDGIRLDRVELRVPELPISIVGISSLLHSDVQRGHFRGELFYNETDGARRLTIRGKCTDLSLAEWSGGFAPHPWRGECPEIELLEFELRDRVPESLHCRGTVRGVVLGDILAPFGLENVGGTVRLELRDVALARAGITRFVAAGECSGVDLESLTAALGWGRMAGEMHIRIDDLTIDDNRLTSLEARVEVRPSGPDGGWIEGELVRTLASKLLGVPLPPILPERIEYLQLGARLSLRDEVLTVFGTHGAREKTILTIRLAGQEIALVNEPKSSFDLHAPLDALRAMLQDYLAARLGAAETRPAAPAAE